MNGSYIVDLWVRPCIVQDGVAEENAIGESLLTPLLI